MSIVSFRKSKCHVSVSACMEEHASEPCSLLNGSVVRLAHSFPALLLLPRIIPSLAVVVRTVCGMRSRQAGVATPAVRIHPANVSSYEATKIWVRYLVGKAFALASLLVPDARRTSSFTQRTSAKICTECVEI